MATGTILVADPQVDLLNVIRSILVSRSYAVFTAGTGAQALDVMAHQASVDLVLSEAALPDMPGPDLLRRVARSYPSTAVMLMTGFTEQRIDARLPFILKPFTAEVLAVRVTTVIVAFREARQTNLQLCAEWDRAVAEGLRLRLAIQEVTAEARRTALRSRQQRASQVAGRCPTVVLLVNADPAWRYLVSRRLSKDGIGTLEAADGGEALELCRRYRISMLITDAEMPGMSGFELADQVTVEFPRVPVLFLAAGAPELAHPALPRGCHPEELAAAVLRICGTDPVTGPH